MASKKRLNVTCELPSGVFTALQKEADAREAASIHQRAREILIEHFANRELGELRDRIAELDGNVAYLGELLRRSTYSVIVIAGKRTSEEANEWIREHMPRTRD
jgi:hypothetical protein